MIIQGTVLSGTRVVDGSIIKQNLSIWLDANDTASYSGTGTTLNDLSGNGYTHTLSNATFTTLSGVKCFDCTTSGVITVNTTGPTLPTTGFTYISWAKVNSSSAGYRTLWRTTPNDHPLLIATGTDNLGMWDNDSAGFVTANYSVTGLSTTWVQWATTGTNTSQTFYINGQQVGTAANGAGGNRHNEWGSTGGGQPFGYVANMFLYTNILSQEQIKQNYYGLKTRFGV